MVVVVVVVGRNLHELELEALSLAASAEATVADTLGIELDLTTRRCEGGHDMGREGQRGRAWRTVPSVKPKRF